MNKVFKDCIRLQFMLVALEFIVKEIEKRRRVEQVNKRAKDLEKGFYESIALSFVATLVIALACQYFFG